MMKSLREAQFKFNKIRSDMMNRKTYHWTVNQEEVDQYAELKRAYAESARLWGAKFESLARPSSTLSEMYINRYGYLNDSEFQRFGTAPVRDSYWVTCIGKEAYGKVLCAEYGSDQPVRMMSSKAPSPCDPKLLSHPVPKYIHKMFGKKSLPQNNSKTVTFRRFPSLLPADYFTGNTLTKALLGLLDRVGYRFNQGAAILNDSWQVNLREAKKENLMLDMFLRGFDGKAEELKKLWESKMMVDVNEELKDLLKVYKDAAEHLVKQEGYKLEQLVGSMKDFIKVHEERKVMERKLSTLVQKLEPKKSCEECEDEEDEE